LQFTLYVLHWIFVLVAMTLSWRRSGAFLHPHFLFTTMISIQIVDFLVRGYDDKNLAFILPENVYEYQLIILLTLSILLILSALVRSSELEGRCGNALDNVSVGPKLRWVIFAVVVLLIGADLYKRFSMVNWSVDEVIRQSIFMPRGQRDWDQAQYAGNFVFAITTILLPLSGVAAGYLSSFGGAVLRLGSALLLLFVLAILITNGSRTPVVLVISSTGLFWYITQRTAVARTIVIGATAATLAVSTSFIYLTRAYGLSVDPFAPQREIGFAYHMDDNYYRAIFAYDYADKGLESWDPFFFFWTIAVNPIPRAFWEDKPLFTQAFYGGYKLDYVTNTFLGETVAMTGVTLSMLVAPIVGLLLYLILFRAQRLLSRPMGLIAYLLVALYVYMCVRSLANLTQFLYLPAATVLLVLFLVRYRKGAPHRNPSRGYLRYR